MPTRDHWIKSQLLYSVHNRASSSHYQISGVYYSRSPFSGDQAPFHTSSSPAERLTHDYPGSCPSAILDNVSVLKFIFHPFLTATEYICTNAPISNAIQDKFSEGITFIGLGALYKTFL